MPLKTCRPDASRRPKALVTKVMSGPGCREGHSKSSFFCKRNILKMVEGAMLRGRDENDLQYTVNLGRNRRDTQKEELCVPFFSSKQVILPTLHADLHILFILSSLDPVELDLVRHPHITTMDRSIMTTSKIRE